MSQRVLETVLTGRNLLSPVLAEAGRDVTAFNSTVGRANAEAGSKATASAEVQRAAAAQVVAANTRATESVVTSSARQATAHRTVMDAATARATAENASSSAVISANTRISGAVEGTTATYQRSAASLREKLGLQALDGDAAARSAAANSRAAQSAAVLASAIDSENVALARETVTTGANTRATVENAAAKERVSLASRAQQTATGALAAANGLLGTSLTPLTAGIGAVGLGLAYAAYSGMTFDKSMSAVKAATQATAGTMGQLRQAAIQAGADTQYSATEAAGGITELAKAGVSTTDILKGGLTGALNLAAAGQLEVADAAEIGATALNVFGLQGSQMSHVADLLAAGAGKAQGSVGDMAAALNQSALVAKNTGLSIEDTSGALALFASNGLLGSDAGTSFKTMLMALNPRSDQAAQLMDQLGLRAYDAQGNFVGLDAYAGKLKNSLSGMSEEQRNAALSTIFGSDAVRAATILYEAGSKGVDEWTNKVNDAGFAQRQAADLTDNLSGDLERLGGSVSTFFTNLGAGTQGALREFVQMLTGIVNVGGDVVGFITSLPGPVQAGAAALALIVALNGPLNGMLTNVTTRVTGMATSFTVAAVESGVAGAALGVFKGAASGLLGMMGGPWGLAITGVTIGLGYLVQWLSSSGDATDDVTASTQSYIDALRQSNGIITENVRQGAAKALQDKGLLDIADNAGISLKGMTDGILGQTGAYEQTHRALKAYQDQLMDAGYAAANDDERAALWTKAVNVGKAADAYEDLAGKYPETVAGQQQIAAAMGDTSDAQTTATGTATDLATQLQNTADAANQAKQQTDAFKLSLDILTGKTVDITAVESAFWEAVDNAKTALDGATGAVLDQNGALDLHSEAGRKTRDTLVGMASDANAWIATMEQQGETSDVVLAKDEELRQQFYNTALQMTGNKDAAQRLTDQYYGIPGERRTNIIAETKAATDAVAALQAKIAALNDKSITITTVLKTYGNNPVDVVNQLRQYEALGGAIGGIVHAYAAGGIEPMSGSVAQVVPPNRKRVIGDRVKDDEFFIPDNNDARSLAIGAEYVRRHPEVAQAALGFGDVSYNASMTGFTAAPSAMPGYSPTATGAGIDYDRLASAIARALPATGSGPLLAVDTVQLVDGTPQDVATELAYKLRVGG